MRAPARWTEADYERAYQELVSRWTTEDDMEATPQSTQREISGASFRQVRELRPNFHYFQELAVTYPTAEGVKAVCPDTLVVLGFLPECDRTNFQVGFEPSDPFWVLEYVSDSTENKDYQENFGRYGRELKVPYYLLFDPRDRERTELALYRHDGEGYQPVEPNARGRLEIPELELEVALVGRWARFWHRGELVPLPEDLARQVAELTEQLAAQERVLGQAREALTERERDLGQAREALTERERQLGLAQEALAARDRELLRTRGAATEANEQRQALLALLRGLVETRARAAGRADILTALPTEDPDQLQRWLAELG